MKVTLHRMGCERLVGERFERPEEVVRWFGAVQSQDYAAAKWGIALRCDGATDAAIDRAFDEGRFLRTHVMRPTWHFVMPEDLRWLLQLTAPRVHKMNAGYYRKVGLADRDFVRARGVMEKALEGTHLTREELAALFQQSKLPADGMPLAYLVMHAELEGVVCSGPRKGKQFTYALLEERVKPAAPRSREEALAELVRRYFTSHGPATVRDCAWWSGLTVTDVKRAIASVGDQLESIEEQGLGWWFAAGSRPPRTPRRPVVHLLPNFDEYLVAFQDREPTFEAGEFSKLDPMRDVMARNLVTLNGRVAGGWRRTVSARQVVVEVKPFRSFSKDELGALEEAVQSYGRFAQLPARAEVQAP